MKRFITLLVLIPLAVLVVALAVANREPVELSLPESLGYAPVSVPLFALLFGTLLFGMLLGSFITWLNQGKFRKEARIRGAEARKMTTEVDKQKKRADELASELTEEPSPEQQAFIALGLPAPQKTA